MVEILNTIPILPRICVGSSNSVSCPKRHNQSIRGRDEGDNARADRVGRTPRGCHLHSTLRVCPESQPHLHALAFQDDEARTTLALWHSLDELDDEISVEVPVPEGSTAWELHDQAGALVQEGDAAPVPVTATGRVSYLKFM